MLVLIGPSKGLASMSTPQTTSPCSPPTKAWGGTNPEATAVPFILLSLQVVLETLAGQRAVKMHGAKTKYLVSLLRQGREGGRQEA